MSVHKFELFHGIVLTKLVRSDKPVSLRLIETEPDEAWAAYKINDAVVLFVKYSTSYHKRKRERSWGFVFHSTQIREIRSMQSEGDVYISLVCGSQETGDLMRVCLLKPMDIVDLLDIADENHRIEQSVRVKYIPNHKLRVSGKGENILIAANALDEWDVPGS